MPNKRAAARRRRLLAAATCLRAVLAIAVVAGLSSSAQAADRTRVESAAGSQHIVLGVGKSMILDLPQDAAEIFVGNPAVANAVVRTPRKIYLIATGGGQTSLFALDKAGHEISSYQISVGRDVNELSEVLHAALPTASIVVRTVNDTLILTGSVDSAEDAQRAADMAQGYVRKLSADGQEGMVVNSLTIRGRDQVMLKVTISEMRRDIAKQLGITSSSWGALSQFNPFAINGPLATGSVAGVAGSTTANLTSGLKLNPSSNLSATLQAFERYGVTRTLAEPTVTAVSGESAKFTVGGQFPYSSGLVCSGSGTTGSTSSTCSAGAAFKNYGITLNFEPVVLSEGRILMHLATDVTDIDYQHAVLIDTVPTPGIIERSNETTVELPSGGSIATAGLIQQKSQQVINGLPGLLDVPILGSLFRSRDYQRNETELVIIVTPIIVKPVGPNQIAKPTDGFSDSSDPQAWLLGRMNKLYATPSNPEAAKNYHGRVGFIQD